MPKVNWYIVQGQWNLDSTKVTCFGESNSLIHARTSFPVEKGTLEVTMSVRKRTTVGKWAHAGLMLFKNKNNYWRLGLVENSEGKRYFELIENYEGIWQAQSKSRYRLPFRSSETKSWSFGQEYRLRLILSDSLLRGEIFDTNGKKIVWRGEYKLSEASIAVREGQLGLQCSGLEVSFSKVVLPKESVKPIYLLDSESSIGILIDNLPGFDTSFVSQILRSLKNHGYNVIPTEVKEFAKQDNILPSNFRIIIIPSANTFPAEVLPSLKQYLHLGGTIIVLGRNPFENLAYQIDEKWLLIRDVKPDSRNTHYLFSITAEEISKWTRSTSNPKSSWNWKIVSDSPRGLEKSIQIKFEDLRGWDVLNLPPFEKSPFVAKENLTCLWAKSSKPNQWITVEWREHDGSRWIAAVRLSDEWKYYILEPNDFEFWKDGSPKTRGFQGDRFHPENAFRLSFGPAESHGAHDYGPFVFWITGIGIVKMPFDVETDSPKFEILYPWYKHYEYNDFSKCKATQWQSIIPEQFEIEGITKITSPIWRPRGLNYVTQPLGRWIPVVGVYDVTGNICGTLASVFVSFSELFPNATWAYIGVNPSDLAIEQKQKIKNLVLMIVKWFQKGVHFVSAGSSQFGYFSDQDIYLGAKVINRSNTKQRISLYFFIQSKSNSKILWTRKQNTDIAPLDLLKFEHKCNRTLREGEYEVGVRLKIKDSIVDEIRQPMIIISEHKPSHKNLVIVKKSGFYINDKIWYAHGINFKPQYVSGMDPSQYSLNWLNPINYDPIAVERDLHFIKSLGMNMVSIQFDGIDSWHCLIDLLWRCERLGLKVNLYIGGAHPLHFSENIVREQIQKARLWQWECLFAYDIAWEPRLGTYNQRCSLDTLWYKWLIEQYGSIENAERDWNFRVNRNKYGYITGPTDNQILNDGNWRVMVAVYRRFIDDLISRRLNRITRLIRELDPYHLIGFRAGWGGTGQPKADRFMPFDLVSGGKHLDFISPEGYGIPDKWPDARKVGFITLYARYAGNDKPIFWSEFGTSINTPFESSYTLHYQSHIWENMYRVILDSWANGSAGWWFPGGYRVDEKSDFGIICPDYKWRPAALIAQKYTHKLLDLVHHHPTKVDIWITIDRDLHPRGLSQIWQRHYDEYIKARKSAKVVALRTEGTGKTSINVPLIAVGNTPCNGRNPPKYLNAEFNWVKALVEGEWVELENGSILKIDKGSDLIISISLGNTGDASWIMPEDLNRRTGTVNLLVTTNGQPAKYIPITKDIPRYDDIILNNIILLEKANSEVKISLRMVAIGRTEFGESFVLQVKIK